jgi:hypothetical protein
MNMEQKRPEFFKLDEADRRVLLWLMDHVHLKSTKSWIEYIVEDYHRRGIKIDAKKLYNETQEE